MTSQGEITAIGAEVKDLHLLNHEQLKDCSRLLIVTRRGQGRSVAQACVNNPRVMQVIEMEEPSRFGTGSALSFQKWAQEGGIRRAFLLSHRPETSLKFRPKVMVANLQPLLAYARWFKMQGVREITALGTHWQEDAMPQTLVDEFVGKHEGERCFVVGNGPSLNDIDMGLLKDEITFGSNRCFLGFEKWGFQFNYWAIEDRLQIEEYLEEYAEGLPDDMPKFVPADYMAYAKFPNTVYFDLLYGNGRSFDDGLSFPAFSPFPHRTYNGFTVTFSMIQLAALMGFKQIYLIGIDHNYGLNTRKLASISGGDQSTWSASDSGTATHFDDRYTSENKKFVKPRPINAEIAYACARQWCAINGVEILNASPNTHLDIFETVRFEDLF